MDHYPASVDNAPDEHLSFTTATALFNRLRDSLRTGQALGADHSTIERLIDEEGTEVLRLLFDGWSNARAASEPVREVTGSDGVHRTHHREAPRRVDSIFGTVVVTRDRVGARGADSLVPADAA